VNLLPRRGGRAVGGPGRKAGGQAGWGWWWVGNAGQVGQAQEPCSRMWLLAWGEWGVCRLQAACPICKRGRKVNSWGGGGRQYVWVRCVYNVM